MNNGLPDILKAAFPNTIPVQRPLTESQAPINIDPNWLAGFVSGEGCFFLLIFLKRQQKQVLLSL